MLSYGEKIAVTVWSALILCQSAVTVFLSADNVWGVCIYKIVPESYALCKSNVTLSKRVDTVRVTVLNHIYTMDISAEKLSVI